MHGNARLLTGMILRLCLHILHITLLPATQEIDCAYHTSNNDEWNEEQYDDAGIECESRV
jgi:hypothetical protein